MLCYCRAVHSDNICFLFRGFSLIKCVCFKDEQIELNDVLRQIIVETERKFNFCTIKVQHFFQVLKWLTIDLPFKLFVYERERKRARGKRESVYYIRVSVDNSFFFYYIELIRTENSHELSLVMNHSLIAPCTKCRHHKM